MKFNAQTITEEFTKSANKFNFRGKGKKEIEKAALELTEKFAACEWSSFADLKEEVVQFVALTAMTFKARMI